MSLAQNERSPPPDGTSAPTPRSRNIATIHSAQGRFLCTQAVLPHMRARTYGRIVSFSSMSWRGNFGQANHVAAKAGIVGLTRTIALEAAREGITANAIAPGLIETPMLASMNGPARDKLVSKVPKSTPATPTTSPKPPPTSAPPPPATSAASSSTSTAASASDPPSDNSDRKLSSACVAEVVRQNTSAAHTLCLRIVGIAGAGWGVTIRN